MDEKMTKESLKQFFQMASQDQELQEKLKAAPNREAYISLVVELGKEKGYSFTRAQVMTALDAAESEAAENGKLGSQLSEKELETVAGGLIDEIVDVMSSEETQGWTMCCLPPPPPPYPTPPPTP